MHASNCDKDSSALGFASCAPALFTKPTIGPRVLISAIACAIDPSSVISQAVPNPTADFPPRDMPATSKPRLSSSMAMASPMPRLAPVTITWPLLIFEYRLALLGESRHSLLGVRRTVGERRQVRLDPQPFMHWSVESTHHRLARQTQG